MKTKIMFATVIAAIMMVNGAAKAETASTKNDTSNLVKSNFEMSRLLSNGRESDFAAYQSDVLPNANDIIEVRTFNKAGRKLVKHHKAYNQYGESSLGA